MVRGMSEASYAESEGPAQCLKVWALILGCLCLNPCSSLPQSCVSGQVTSSSSLSFLTVEWG